MDPLALVCSVELELAPLLRRMTGVTRLATPALSIFEGRLNGVAVVAVPAGMGKTNAARSLTALLERRRVRGAVGFGVAGAYAGSGLAVGDVALASMEQYGDEGVETPTGWISCEGIGIPLLASEDGPRFNEMPVDPAALEAAQRALTGGNPRVGPFVTVSACSGTAARGEALAARFGALCETMEGAAYAHVSAAYGVPFLEIRGVSNLVEDRDLTRWRLADAAEAAAAALEAVVPAWPHDRPSPQP